jgi:hypothetical protein
MVGAPDIRSAEFTAIKAESVEGLPRTRGVFSSHCLQIQFAIVVSPPVIRWVAPMRDGTVSMSEGKTPDKKGRGAHL